MEVEAEKVVKLLFPNNILETCKENPEFYQYLSKVGRYDVDSLNKEQNHLIDEKNFMQQNTQNIIYSNYKIFIESSKTSREVFKEFHETELQLDDIITKIPKFVKVCKLYNNTSHDINIRRSLNSMILNKSTQILEILELPQLMDFCVQNNQYNEVFELSHYARQLAVKYKDIPIILDIVNKIEKSWSVMINQILNSLKEDLPLPKCLQLIGLLHSMHVFTESELRIKFIQSRDCWFMKLLESIPTEDPTIHLTKTIELSRIHLFNIITQYKAMFNEDTHLTFGRGTVINNSIIFSQWLEEKVSQFLKTLEHDLPNVNSIDLILGQCTYFGLSFGRVGADFNGRMSDIFIKVIRTKSENIIIRATNKFEKDIENYKIFYKLQKSEGQIEAHNKTENPPEQLIEYYPLAEYCNGLITAFNELRLNIPVTIVQFIQNLLQNSLHTAAKILQSFFRKREKNCSSFDKETRIKFIQCFSEQLIPYVQHCLHDLFPPNQVAAQLGISVSQLQKEHISYLNQDKILVPLRNLLSVENISLDIVTDHRPSKQFLIIESNSNDVPEDEDVKCVVTEDLNLSV